MKVLIVDDILVNRLLLKEILKTFPDTVIKDAENGKDAIEKIISNEFDIVLMDIEMPVMNGLEATQYIRTKLESPKCDIPIIAITAHNPNNFIHMYSKVGFNDIMIKPYSIEKIKKILNQYI